MSNTTTVPTRYKVLIEKDGKRAWQVYREDSSLGLILLETDLIAMSDSSYTGIFFANKDFSLPYTSINEFCKDREKFVVSKHEDGIFTIFKYPIDYSNETPCAVYVGINPFLATKEVQENLFWYIQHYGFFKRSFLKG